MSSELETGDLVRIIDDNGSEIATLGIYVCREIPAESDIGVAELIDDMQFIDHRFTSTKRSSQFFYAIPEHWHHVLLVGDRILRLNSGFYTVTKSEE